MYSAVITASTRCRVFTTGRDNAETRRHGDTKKTSCLPFAFSGKKNHHR